MSFFIFFFLSGQGTIDANAVTVILKDTVNIALIDLLVECIAFREAIDDR